MSTLYLSVHFANGYNYSGKPVVENKLGRVGRREARISSRLVSKQPEYLRIVPFRGLIFFPSMEGIKNKRRGEKKFWRELQVLVQW